MDVNKRHQPFFYGYVIVAAGFVAQFIGWGAYALSYGVFFKPIMAELQWTRAETAAAYSVSLLVQASLGMTTGWLTDKLGPRILVVIFGSCLGWSFLLISQVNSLWHFIVSYAVVGGIGASILNVPLMATVSRWFVKKRGLMTGIVQAGVGFGGFFLAPFSGWLILLYGWRKASMVLGTITAALMILSGLFLIRDPSEIGQFPDGIPAETPKEIKPRKQPPKPPGLSFKAFVSTVPFWLIAGIYVSFGYFRSTFVAHAAAHVQDMGFSLSDGANVLAVISFSSIFGRVGMGRLGDKIGNRRTLIISFTATTLAFIWLFIAGSLWELYLFAIIYGFGWGAVAVLRFAVTAEVFGLASVGFIMGTVGISELLTSAFSSYFGGFIFDISGSYDIVFFICLVISLLGILLSWRLKPGRFVR